MSIRQSCTGDAVHDCAVRIGFIHARTGSQALQNEPQRFERELRLRQILPIGEADDLELQVVVQSVERAPWVLEMEVVANCAIDMPERAIERLTQNLAYQRAALESGDVQGFHELDTTGLALVRVKVHT